MKKIFNFEEFLKEGFNNYRSDDEGKTWTPEIGHDTDHDDMLGLPKTIEEPIDADYEELEFCPQCGESWEGCSCENHDMTHVPEHEMELNRETNEKKKMNAGFAAYLAKKKAGKKADDDKEKDHKSGKKSKSGSKPDFLNLDKDGNKKESTKKAAQDAKK